MITKIPKIKNLGLVFKDFTWGTDVPDFKRFNLIYGWNGCGKTTLTRLFDVLSGDSIPLVEYEVEESGVRYNQSSTFPKRVRVFNQDYVQKNVEILASRANSISILLGEENKDLIQSIEEDEIKLNGDPKDSATVGLIAEHHGYTFKKGRKEKELEGKFSSIASVIGAATLGSSTASRTYRSPNAHADFNTITSKELLSDGELDICASVIKQEHLPQEKLIELKRVFVSDAKTTEPVRDLIESILTKGRELLARTVESETIARLTENPDISEWVEKGIELHKKHSSEECEYCGNKISSERIKLLSAHFNEADRKLKDEIDTLLGQLRDVYSAVSNIEIPDSSLRFYSELRPGFEADKTNLLASQKTLLEQITLVAEELKTKKLSTTEPLELNFSINLASFEKDLEAMNEVIRRHNTKTADFQKVKEDATLKLKKHYLSTIFDEVKKLEEDIRIAAEDIKAREIQIEETQNRIATNKTQISSTHRACEEINKGLEAFLGRNELIFVPHTQKEADESGPEKEVDLGYRIMRGNVPAEHLSEGEKTAISFVYFIVHLRDRDFPLADGIVVIDDPISSLDSNSVYQAFSFLKNSVETCCQVFIFTHNFEFLKLLLNWRKGTRDMKDETGFYKIKNTFENGSRKAHVEIMDKELVHYESEYHYLFKILKTMRDAQDDSIEQAYPVPNIARKVWESFLMFRVPNGGNPYSKMTELKKEYDSQKLDAIYKFTNDQSHITGSGFDPALVPEAKKIVGELLEMMETIAPEHFKIIDGVTN